MGVLILGFDLRLCICKHQPVGACSPRKYLENTCSEIASETSLGQNMVLEYDKLTCTRSNVTLQENLVQTYGLGCKCADHCDIVYLLVTITNAGLTVNNTAPTREIHCTVYVVTAYSLASGPNASISLPTLLLISNEHACV